MKKWGTGFPHSLVNVKGYLYLSILIYKIYNFYKGYKFCY
jgi:hypothetical protein